LSPRRMLGRTSRIRSSATGKIDAIRQFIPSSSKSQSLISVCP
jgi:hypothetical protein